MNNLKIFLIAVILGFAGSYYHHTALKEQKQGLTEQFNKTLKPVSQSIYTRACEDSIKTLGVRMAASQGIPLTAEVFNQITYNAIQYCKDLSAKRIQACENNPNNPNFCLPGEQ